MAGLDDDWKKFMDATEEDPEEVETDPTEGEEHENPGANEDDPETDPSKSKKEEEDNPDDPEEDPDEEDDPEEDDPAGDKKPTGSDYQPRLKQFINSEGDYDLEKVEKSYIESGKQAVQLDKDLKEIRENYGQLLGAIKSQPEVAKQLFGDDGAKQLLENENISAASKASGGDKSSQPDISRHPLLRHLDAQMKNASRKEYEAFTETHPESVTDPDKRDKIGEFLKLHGAMYQKSHDGEIPSMKESLEAAYRYYGWDLDIKGKEDVATAAKKTAATRRTSSTKRAATKKEASKGEEFFAKKLGVKL